MVEVSSQTLDLEALRSFVAVARLGSLAAAAEQRHRTVSALSMQIKRLETRLEARLLVRGARGMTLTASGEALLGEARELLRHHDGLVARISGRGLSGRVSFGMPEDYASRLVGRLLPDFLARHPDVVLEAVTATSGELARRLERGQLSLVVALDRPHRLSGGEPLWRTSPVWAGARDLALAPEAPLPLALHPVDCPYRQLGIEALEAGGRPWHAVFTSTSIHALETAVEAGLAVSILERDRLTPAMRELGEAEGLPRLADCQAELHYGRGVNAASWPAVEALGEMIKARLGQRS
ncbi:MULTISPECIES: LysR substrate-binding domain-containing protein [Halomonas]|uniref:Transcriptional regulator n=1 Tax=Halomonas halophila TaxID=29573 RepID=A0ABQ0U9N3_9GAMM|nr:MULTISPECIES: LysR substrate-binding domain-containing protein [Halomonas]PSJ22795.1 LysR family transcriptional regulator [Halomonas sp. ND22Bw]MDR5889271.1 LysR substrate-binding domain-containing protein [Halomonas salina]RAH37264.1 LysR family transcriptional regulator [Halomonas sp. SL1]WJY07175.1 LysR substrate-binding domain-containing protein [Halomonas halophila]GEK73729.1 transcriptional regulator [Halomonas halophila]